MNCNSDSCSGRCTATAAATATAGRVYYRVLETHKKTHSAYQPAPNSQLPARATTPQRCPTQAPAGGPQHYRVARLHTAQPHNNDHELCLLCLCCSLALPALPMPPALLASPAVLHSSAAALDDSARPMLTPDEHVLSLAGRHWHSKQVGSFETSVSKGDTFLNGSKNTRCRWQVELLQRIGEVCVKTTDSLDGRFKVQKAALLDTRNDFSTKAVGDWSLM